MAPLPTCCRKYHMAPAPSAAAPPPKPLTKQVTRQLPQSVKLARSLSKFADPSDRSSTESLKSSSPLPRHIIRPDSTRKLWWDAYAVIILIYAVIVAPLRLSFDVEDYCPSSVWILEAVIDVCFVIDLVLNFFTAVYVSHLSSTHTRARARLPNRTHARTCAHARARARSDARVRCWRGDRSARGANPLLFGHPESAPTIARARLPPPLLPPRRRRRSTTTETPSWPLTCASSASRTSRAGLPCELLACRPRSSRRPALFSPRARAHTSHRPRSHPPPARALRARALRSRALRARARLPTSSSSAHLLFCPPAPPCGSDLISSAPIDLVLSLSVHGCTGRGAAEGNDGGGNLSSIGDTARLVRILRLVKLLKILRILRLQTRFEELGDRAPALNTPLVKLLQPLFASFYFAVSRTSHFATWQTAF